MIDNLGLGPPAQGFPGPQMREASREPREDASGSFKRTLGEKSDPKISDNPRSEKIAERKSKDPDERPTEVRREKSVEPGPKRAKGARDQAIREFMDSFESEFRIPPTKIVEAMAKIEPQKLDETPESTASDVIEQLDIAPEDKDKAMAMYAGLLAQLQTIDRAAKPVPMVPTDSAMMAPQIRERLMQSKDRREAMGAAVENLNQKFWMTNVRANSGMPVQNAQGSAGMKALDAAKMQVDPAANFSQIGEDGAMALDPDALETLPAESDFENATPAMGGLKPMDAEAKPQVPQGMRGARKATPEEMKRVLENLRNAAQSLQSDETSAQIERLASEGDTEGEAAGAMAMAKVGGKATVTEASTDVSAASAAKSFMVQNSPKEKNGGFGQQGHANGGGNAKGETSSDGKSSGEMKSFSLASAGAAAPVPLKMEDVAAALKNIAPAGTPSIVANTQDHETNVRQIMNQAQYLIKKGGGEVKVEMSPEGLGNLQMKVMVKDGKVNVQMAAETNEAKKAIESSLPELRSSLAAHKLSVDHVKVDVVSGPSTDTQTRNDTNNPNPQQHRETRQFWNQFQENFGNRGARDGLWDLPDMKGYRTAKTPTALEPASDGKAASAKRADGRGSGLNLVA